MAIGRQSSQRENTNLPESELLPNPASSSQQEQNESAGIGTTSKSGIRHLNTIFPENIFLEFVRVHGFCGKCDAMFEVFLRFPSLTVSFLSDNVRE
jgi:hypothetical protein